jgi:transposase
MIVRIALARKLLVRLNAKARDARAHYAYAT